MEQLGTIEELDELAMRDFNGGVTTVMPTSQSANRAVAIPAMLSSDRFVFEDVPETLLRKTMSTGCTLLGINSTTAGYLVVSESVPAFMASWRAWFEPTSAKAASWALLTASELGFASGTTSNIQEQFTANFEQHEAFRTRLTDLEGTVGARPASAKLTLTTAVKADTTGAHLTFVQKTIAAPAQLSLYGTPTDGDIYVLANRAVGDLTIVADTQTFTLVNGDFLWLRFSTTDNLWYVADGGYSSGQDLYNATVTLTAADNGQDTTRQPNVFVLRPATALGVDSLYQLADDSQKTYWITNSWLTTNIVVSPGNPVHAIDGSSTLTILPQTFAVLRKQSATVWTVIHSGATVNSGSGGGTIDQDTIELTVSTEDVSDFTWLFAVKNASGAVTFTLRASPDDGTLIQVRNASSSGDITVAANTGQTINGLASTTIVPGEFSWFVWRSDAWYTLESDVSAVSDTAISLPIAAGGMVTIGEPCQWLTHEQVETLQSRDLDVMNSSYTIDQGICRLSSTMYMALCLNWEVKPQLVLIERLGYDLRVLSTLELESATFPADVSTTNFAMTALSSTLVAVRYCGKIFAVSVSGETMTKGTGVTYTVLTYIKQCRIIALSATKFVVLWSEGAANTVYARCATVSGVTITAGTRVTDSTGGYLMDAAYLTATTMLVTSGSTSYVLYSRVLENTTGTTLVFRTLKTYTEGGGTVPLGTQDGRLVVVSPTEVHGLFYGVDNAFMQSFKFVISGTTVSTVTRTATTTASSIVLGVAFFIMYADATRVYISRRPQEVYGGETNSFFHESFIFQIVADAFALETSRRPDWPRVNCFKDPASIYLTGACAAEAGEIALIAIHSVGGVIYCGMRILSLNGGDKSGIAQLTRTQLKVSGHASPTPFPELMGRTGVTVSKQLSIMAGEFVLSLFCGTSVHLSCGRIGPSSITWLSSTPALPVDMTDVRRSRFTYCEGYVAVSGNYGMVLCFVDAGGNVSLVSDVVWPIGGNSVTVALGVSAGVLTVYATCPQGGQTYQWEYTLTADQLVSAYSSSITDQWPGAAVIGTDTIVCSDVFVGRLGPREAAPVAWTSFSVAPDIKKTFLFNGAALWLGAFATNTVFMTSSAATTNVLTTPLASVDFVVPLTTTTMLAVCTNYVGAISYCIVTLTGSTLTAGSQFYMPTPYNASFVFDSVSAVSFGTSNNYITIMGYAVANYALQVYLSVEGSAVRPSTVVNCPGLYLGTVTAEGVGTATVELATVLGDQAGLTPGMEYGVAVAGGLTASKVLAEAKAGLALTSTTLKQRGVMS